MTQTIKAIFDGKVFKPEEPVDIEPDSHVNITVHVKDEVKPAVNAKSFLRTVADMNLEGPADWSENFEDYLNGDRKLP